MLLYNGRVYPLNGIITRAEALAIRQGRILKLGPRQRCGEALSGHRITRLEENINMPSPSQASKEGAEERILTVDLQGKTVLPSFTDSLASLWVELMAQIHLDLSTVKNLPEIFALVEQQTRQTEKGEWILGYGWNRIHWGWQRFPHRADLDLVSPHHPVALFSSDHRIAWINSFALDRLEIRRDTAHPVGGKIERDYATGAATGILKEKALRLIQAQLSTPDAQALQDAFRKVVKTYHSLGVTSLQSFDTWEEHQIISAVEQVVFPGAGDRGGSTCGLDWISHLHYPSVIKEGEITKGIPLERFHLGGIWLTVDGTLLSETAWMKEPYTDDWNKYGITLSSKEEISQMVKWCHQQGYPPLLVASGDQACHEVLESLETEGFATLPLRCYLVMGDLIHADDWKSVKSIKPGYITNPYRILAHNEVGENYWGERWTQALNLRAIQDSGGMLYWGSGESLSHWSPLDVLKGAITPRQEGALPQTGSERLPHPLPRSRSSPQPDGNPPAPFPLTMDEALLALTRRFSGSSDKQTEGGTLSTGQFADLVILSGDPYQTPPEQLSDLTIEATLYHGEVVYDPHSLFAS